MSKFRSFLFPVLFLIIAGPLLHAQEALPSAEQVLDTYVRVTGGMEAYNKIRTRIVTATMEMPGQDLLVQMTQYYARPDKSCLISEIAGMGGLSAGSSGDVVWTNNPMSGPKLLDGKQAATMKLINAMDRIAHWRDILVHPVVTERETLDGKSCFVVEAKTANEDDMTLYFEESTGLLLRMDYLFVGFMGISPSKYFFSDYKTVGGIALPYQTRVVTGRQELLMTIESVQNNVEIPDSIFLPEDIQKLLGK